LDTKSVPETFDGTPHHHLDLTSKIKLGSEPDLKIGRRVFCPRECDHSPHITAHLDCNVILAVIEDFRANAETLIISAVAKFLITGLCLYDLRAKIILFLSRKRV
jgi:hypothetical protein